MDVGSTAPAGPLTETDVRGLLEEIIDPCSANAGAPAGLQTMGLVRSVDIRPTVSGKVDVRVVLGLTEPGCLMGWVFVNESHDRLEALEVTETVSVRLDTQSMWTTDDLEPAYREKLAAARKAAFDRARDQRSAQRAPGPTRPRPLTIERSQARGRE